MHRGTPPSEPDATVMATSESAAAGGSGVLRLRHADDQAVQLGLNRDLAGQPRVLPHVERELDRVALEVILAIPSPMLV